MNTLNTKPAEQRILNEDCRGQFNILTNPLYDNFCFLRYEVQNSIIPSGITSDAENVRTKNYIGRR